VMSCAAPCSPLALPTPTSQSLHLPQRRWLQPRPSTPLRASLSLHVLHPLHLPTQLHPLQLHLHLHLLLPPRSRRTRCRLELHSSRCGPPSHGHLEGSR